MISSLRPICADAVLRSALVGRLVRNKNALHKCEQPAAPVQSETKRSGVAGQVLMTFNWAYKEHRA